MENITVQVRRLPGMLIIVTYVRQNCQSFVKEETIQVSAIAWQCIL